MPNALAEVPVRIQSALTARICPIEIYAGYTLAGILALSGAYMLFLDFRRSKLITASAEHWNKVTSALKGDEKTVYDLIASTDGVMFQSDIVDNSGLSKVKVSRVLDRLEARNLLERRRRGMSNVVVLKTPEAK
jgi:Uncharacterized membrane-associated protein/domain